MVSVKIKSREREREVTRPCLLTKNEYENGYSIDAPLLNGTSRHDASFPSDGPSVPLDVRSDTADYRTQFVLLQYNDSSTGRPPHAQTAKGASINDIRRIFGFFDPLPALSAFGTDL